MQKFFQIVGFLTGIFAFGVGVYALFKGVGGSAGGSFKLDDVVEFKGDSTAIVFGLAGVFLIVAAAGWFRNKQKADDEQKRKLAVARDLRKYVQASEPLVKFAVAPRVEGLHPDLKQALAAYPPTISVESQEILQELDKKGR